MNAIDIKQLATSIRQLRESLYYSQEYMGVKLGIGQNAYSKIELGKCKITVERLAGIANILNIDLLDLLGPALNNRKTSPAVMEKVA
ncbi:hypothetical protein GCM10028827_03290 [Mucilaginibacter myungsuensis]|uniref:Helix-turn-helix transcriptional regulator n=2 Tax=Mucilaginibacter myungsuensis TaxID=649104 RepID=A0A929PXK2_9SPHI|nr:helix-turn-helix transcriptional regulator [Mucilaginibacter myungsuensis]